MMQVDDGTQPQGTHYWLMVLENGDWTRAASGTCSPPRGATRYDMERRIRAELLQVLGPEADGARVTHFDIQPNAL